MSFTNSVSIFIIHKFSLKVLHCIWCLTFYPPFYVSAGSGACIFPCFVVRVLSDDYFFTVLVPCQGILISCWVSWGAWWVGFNHLLNHNIVKDYLDKRGFYQLGGRTLGGLHQFGVTTCLKDHQQHMSCVLHPSKENSLLNQRFEVVKHD